MKLIIFAKFLKKYKNENTTTKIFVSTLPSRSYLAHYVLPKLRSYSYVGKCGEGLPERALN
jgi:hypothetical protein